MESAEDHHSSRRNAPRRVPQAAPATRIGDIIHGRRAITSDTALRLARFFGNSPQFWLNLQQMYDLSKARIELGDSLERDIEVYARA
jgi:plasmid maintenance system antidote protein VapI